MKAIKLITVLLIFIQMPAFAGDKYYISPSALKFKYSSGSNKDTAAINTLVRKGTNYISSKGKKLDLVKECIDSAVLICEKKNIEIPARLHLLLAQYHFATNDLRSASEEAAIALKKSAGANEFDVLARTNLFLGDYYRRTRFYKESLEYYGNAVTIAKKNGLKGILWISYLYQAEVYRTIGDTRGFSQNLQLMIDASQAENDSISMARGYYLLGTAFCGDSVTSVTRKYKMADSCLRISLKVSLIKKDTDIIASSWANLGWNYYLEKEYDTAVIYYNKSLTYSLPAKLYSASANFLGNLGTIYRDLKLPEKSIKYYQKGIEQAQKENDIRDLWWIYRDMSEMYLWAHDTANAYKNYVLYKKYSDIWINKGNLNVLADAKTRYDVDTQNKEVELLSLRLKNNRILNYAFAGFIFLAALIGFLLFRGSKLKDKRRISEMDRKISEITQANLRQQMNPHFIFNTLNSIQYYMYQHDKLATNNYLTKFSSLMRKVLDNSQHTSIPLSDELSALNLYLELESIRFKDKFEYKITLDEEIDPLMHKVPTMLIQPYVENSICHGLMPKEGKGFVNIDLKLKEDYILCTIEDNGIGREAAKERNQKREGNHNSLGTQIAKSRLDLVNELYGTSLHTIYTDLRNENGEPAGTRVEIHIPIIV
jgi:tetratricopeptide (TPR) repeat protein